METSGLLRSPDDQSNGIAEPCLGHGTGQDERVATQGPDEVEAVQAFGEFLGSGEVLAEIEFFAGAAEGFQGVALAGVVAAA